MNINGKIPFLFLISLISGFLFAGSEKQIIDFKNFDEKDWEKARGIHFPSAGSFVPEKGGVANFIPEKTSSDDLYRAKNGVGFALRLLKDKKFEDGKLELELELESTAAPSIYFRTQVESGVHKETYNLVVFNHTEKKANYQGINLWKWNSSWEHKDGKSGWVKLASWNFPVPHGEKIRLGVEFKGKNITVFFNSSKIGSVFDKDALPAGKVGVCVIEGKSYFYKFEAGKK